MKKFKEGNRKEIQAKIDAYKAAQQRQLQFGGPGPVASEEIMELVNEHNGEFEIEGEKKPKKARKQRKLKIVE